MGYPIVHYRPNYQADDPTVTLDAGGEQQTLTESQLLDAIKKVKEQRAKYKDVREWQFVLNVYQGAIEVLRMQTETG